MTATRDRRDDQPPLTGTPRMSVATVRRDRQRALVRVVGELDLSTAAPLWAVLHSHLAAGRRFVRLDLSAVTFLDATALGGLTVAHQEALERRGTLVITGAHSVVARLLTLTGLDTVLFVGGPRADDDLGPPPLSEADDAPAPTVRADRPAPSTTPAVARSSRPARHARPPANRPATG